MDKWRGYCRLVLSLDHIDFAILRTLIMLHKVKRRRRQVAAVIAVTLVGTFTSACTGMPDAVIVAWLVALILLTFLLLLALILFRK